MILALTGIVSLFFLWLAIASLRRPAYAFALTLVMFPYEQLLQSQFSFFVQHRAFMNFLVAGISGVAIVSTMLQGRRTLLMDRLTVLVGMLFTWVVLSTMWSADQALSAHTIRYWLPYLVAGVIILPLSLNTPQDIRDAIKALFIVGTPLLIALAVTPMQGRSIILLNEDQLEGGNPLAVGTFAAEMAVCAVGVLMAGRKSPQTKAALLGLAGLATFVILRSGSRGQLLAAMFGIAVISFGVLTGARRKNFFYAFAPVCILLAGVVLLKETFVSDPDNRLAARWELQHMQTAFEESRIGMSKKLLTEFLEAASRNPLLLIGGFGAAYSYQLLGTYCHVVAVESLCEYGIVGFILYMMILYSAAHAVWKLYKSSSIAAVDKIPIAFIAGFFALHFALTFKQGSMLGSNHYFALAVVLGRLQFANLKAQATQAQGLLSRNTLPILHGHASTLRRISPRQANIAS